MSVGAEERVEVTLQVNDESHQVSVEPRLLLLDALRDELGLGGTHAGCEQGACGACTILLDGEPMRSCLMFAVQARGRAITTIEGLRKPAADELHLVQQAFVEHHGLQCGFCTPGMVMTSVALLAENPRPTEAEIRVALGGNVCRCTGYVNIVRAVQAAAEAMQP
jgi:carbon-monoxide dehydrogenase small subunit